MYMSLSNGNPLSWATEVEILATSEHFNMDIFIWMKSNEIWDWHRYSIFNNCDHDRGYITIIYKASHYNLIVNTARPCKCINVRLGNANPNCPRKESQIKSFDKSNLIYPKIVQVQESGTASQYKNKHNVTFISININGIRGKKNTLAAFLDT